MRGQYETPGPAQDDGFSPGALGADIAAVIEAVGARHLLGHSYGGLVVREALLAGAGERRWRKRCWGKRPRSAR